MLRLVSGLIAGFVLGVAATGHAQRVVGQNGYLVGWEVTMDGGTVCTDPYVHIGSQEIECD